MCSCNDLMVNIRMENIASRVFDKQMDNYKKDIYSTLKYYIKYDPELTTFRNMSVDYYNKMLDEKTKVHVLKAGTQINKLIDAKLYEIEKTPPADIIIASTLKQVEPSINTNKTLATVGITLGLCNLVGLVYLFKR